MPLLLGNPADIEGDSRIGIVTTSAPVLRSLDSTVSPNIQIGEQMVIATLVRNNDPIYDWSAYVLVEVRDQDGITVLLSWQSGIIATGSQKEIGISWTPDNPGDYQVRTFAISDFQSPRVMSGVKVSHATVVDAKERTHGLCSGSAGCFAGTVTKIIDGDTLDINDTRVRLSLVDTPELGEAGYEEATEFTAELCLVGSNVLVDQDDGQPFDDFGRMIAKVTCEGDMVINAELVESRHAQILTAYCEESEFSAESWAEQACQMEGGVIQDIPVEDPPAEEPLQEEEDCDPSYPDVCIPSPPPDLDCGDISFRKFRVVGSDPHRFDGDGNGIGCES